MRSLSLLAWIVVALLVLCALSFAPGSLAQTRRQPYHPEAALARLRHDRGRIRARVDATSGEVRFLQGVLGHGRPGQGEQTARDFFTAYADLFGVTDPVHEIELHSIDRDRRGYTSVRFDQRVGGVRVLGSDVRAEIDPSGTLHTVHGRLVPQPQPPAVRPRITRAQALAHAQLDVSAPGKGEGVPDLFVVRRAASDRLVWKVVLDTDEPGRWQVLVDALDGSIVQRTDILDDVKVRQTYSAGFSDVLPGTLVRSEGQPPSVTNDVDVNAAHANAGLVYDYYFANFDRDSIDGAGMPIVSSVHYRQQYEGAFWTGSQIVYGDGDGQRFGPLDRALDIAAHELTHGVTERTAHLTYSDQPGALNEAVSDIFGALVDSANWEIGEDAVTPGLPGDALRSLDDPTHYGQPSVWGEYIDTALDNGGVHLNSGIINHVGYMIGRAIGRVELGQILYRTLTMKLTSGATFEDTRDLMIESCAELEGTFGITEADCRAVQSAFAGSGIGEWPAAPTGQAYQLYLPLVGHSTLACGDDVVRNGGFEAGQEGWPNTGGIIGAWSGRTIGSESARLSGTSLLLQRMPLPRGAVRLSVSFKVFGEPGAALSLALEDPSTRAQLGSMTINPIPIDSWQDLSTVLAGASGQQEARLVIRHSAASGNIYLDDIRVQADCSAP